MGTVKLQNQNNDYKNPSFSFSTLPLREKREKEKKTLIDLRAALPSFFKDCQTPHRTPQKMRRSYQSLFPFSRQPVSGDTKTTIKPWSPPNLQWMSPLTANQMAVLLSPVLLSCPRPVKIREKRKKQATETLSLTVEFFALTKSTGMHNCKEEKRTLPRGATSFTRFGECYHLASNNLVQEF